MPRVEHFEIYGDDPDKLIEFYKIFGWSFNKWEGPMDYWMINTGKEDYGINGGLGRTPKDGLPPSLNTIGVKNLDEFIKKIEGKSGKILVPKMAIPGVGYMCYFEDPQGNKFGLMQSDENAK